MLPASRSDRTALMIATVCLWTIIAVFAVWYLTGGADGRQPAGRFQVPRDPTVETPRYRARELFDV